MTLDQIKQQIAIRYDCISWTNLLLNSELKADGVPAINKLHNEVAEEYRKEGIEAAVNELIELMPKVFKKEIELSIPPTSKEGKQQEPNQEF